MIETRIIIGLVLAVLLSVAITAGTAHYMDLREKAAQGELDAEKVKTIDSILKDSQDADLDRERSDQAVGNAAARYDTQLQEAIENDEVIRDRDARPIPDRVRQLAKERRLARERSDRAEDGSDEGNTK